MEFPLLGWSARLQRKTFEVLDETALPEAITYITVSDYSEAVTVIRDMKTRAFGQLLTVFYALIITIRNTEKNALEATIAHAVDALNKSRPTFSFKTYTAMVKQWVSEGMAQNKVDSKEFAENKILGFLERIKQMRLNRAELAAALFEDGDVVLTHCNTSGELLLIAQFCKAQGKYLSYYATETRPYFQGRLTAWELQAEGFPVTLIPDNRTASVIASGIITKIITGADRVALNGDVVNKTGTYQIATMAKKYGIPFFSLVQDPGSTETGDAVPIEQRDSREVTTFKGRMIYPEHTNAYYPAFDMTPHTLITKLITFNAALSPSELPEAWSK
ncbi:MAG: S-methyl-5-thioribose-1-phosphate isomerase [Fibrobacterales bacterium]